MYTRWIIILFLVWFSGCMVGPNYKRPVVSVPQKWRFTDSEAKEIANPAWWEQFGDTVLNNLLIHALEHNKDIKIASARVDEYQGRLISARSLFFPQVNINAGVGVSNNVQTGGEAAVPVGRGNLSTMFYQADLNAELPLDIWGKYRRAYEASKANLLGAQEVHRAVILSLVTNIANGYIALRSLDEQYKVTQEIAKRFKDNYHLFLLQYDQGLISDVELNQARSEYEQALSVIPALSIQIAQQENLLSILSGNNPSSIRRGKTLSELMLPVVPSGLPSSILYNRPDILEAEQNLIAANAQIGVARSQYFPSISLTGLLGIVSTEFTKLLTDPIPVWSASAPLILPIFNVGAIRGQVKSATAIQTQVLLQYQQLIQTAFREVEDALVDQEKTRLKISAIENQLGVVENTACYARIRFNAGYTGYIDVLTAEVTMFQIRLLLTQAKAHLFEALVNLYVAMGGGWAKGVIEYGLKDLRGKFIIF